MFGNYANVVEELVGEPRLSVEEQINRARGAVQERSTDELNRLVVDLSDNPTLGNSRARKASIIFYEPQGRTA